ncbi:MAG: hypothetical protein Q8N18_03785 [Opitutaceae bacterium]|nr:hypothetical protein [Opitutaceae bacterium]
MNPTPARLIRRTHMYLALFLTPWMIIYALSGLFLNHGEFVRRLYGGSFGAFEKVDDRPYATVFSADADHRMIGGQILAELGLAGSFIIQRDSTPARLIINRAKPFVVHRVTYFRPEARLLIEKMTPAAPALINRAHFRHGYDQPFLASKIWGFVVDLVIVGMVFWVASGVIMWWEIKPARAWGAACAIVGFGLFGVLLLNT